MKPAARRLFVAEPPSEYLLRPPLVVDCSVLSAVIFNEPARDEALQLLAGKRLNAPYLMDHEVVSVALKKARSGWPARSLADALADYTVQEIEMHATDPLAQHDLATRYGLTAYDAAYLWLAATLKTPLATFDGKLAAAARTHLSALS